MRRVAKTRLALTIQVQRRKVFTSTVSDTFLSRCRYCVCLRLPLPARKSLKRDDGMRTAWAPLSLSQTISVLVASKWPGGGSEICHSRLALSVVGTLKTIHRRKPARGVFKLNNSQSCAFQRTGRSGTSSCRLCAFRKGNLGQRLVWVEDVLNSGTGIALRDPP